MVATSKTIAATGKTIESVIEILRHYAPIFDSCVRRDVKPDDASYACILCDVMLVKGQEAGISYSNNVVRWAHPDCLRAVAPKLDAKTMPLASLNTDWRAKKKASKAFYERQALMTGKTIKEKVDVAKLTEKIRADVEAELHDKIETEIDEQYGEIVAKAVEKIDEYKARIATLEGKLAAMTASLAEAETVAPAPVTINPGIKANLDADAPLTDDEKKQNRAKTMTLTPEQRAARRAKLSKAS